MEHSLLSNSPDDDMEPLFTGTNRRQQTRTKNYMTGVFLGVVGIVIVASMIAAAGKFNGFTDQPSFVVSVTPIINTTCGFIQGQQEDAVFVFRGIRYAAPPIGPLRWLPTKTLKETSGCWDGIYRAYNFQSSCYQYDPQLQRQEGSEDCLFLNVWTPQLDRDAMLDVMVYIHGGGLMEGSGNVQGETPTPEISKSSNAVFVSFNYRLNAFGFMALEELSWKSPDGVSGNYGLQDQVMVLRWIKENIAAFGGNPNKVTIFGLDGGSASVLALMAAPDAAGLFHKAWVMSGLPRIETPLTQAHADNKPFVNNSKCGGLPPAETLVCLYALSAEEVMKAIEWSKHPKWAKQYDRDLPTRGSKTGGIIVIDGVFLPWSPLDAVHQGLFSDVPLIVGNMAQAIDNQPQPLDLVMWTWSEYDTYLADHLDKFMPNLSAKAISLYPHHITPEYQFTSLVTDLRFTCPTNQMAAAMAHFMKSPVVRYVATSKPSEPVKSDGVVKKYAFSGWDVLSYFGVAKHYVDNPTKRDRLFMYNLRNIIGNGHQANNSSEIKPYPQSIAVVSEVVVVQEKYATEACELWHDNHLYPHAVWRM